MADRASLDQAKLEAAIANRILAEWGLATGVRASLGHTSMRVPGDPDKFVVKGRGYRVDVLSRMRPEDMVVCDLEGNWVDGPPNSWQCNEIKDRKSTRLNSSHSQISYAVFCLKKKKKKKYKYNKTKKIKNTR